MHAFAAEVDEGREVKPLVWEFTLGGGAGEISLHNFFRGLKVRAASGPTGKAIQAPAAMHMVERSIAVGAVLHLELLSLIFANGTNGTGLDTRITAEFGFTELLRGHQFPGL